MLGELKYNANQFHGKQELERSIEFLNEQNWGLGYIDNLSAFGIIKAPLDTGFLNFKIELGTNLGTIKLVKDSVAINNEGKIIYCESFDNLAIPTTVNDEWYWIKITRDISDKEIGVCTIDSQGNLTGIGTQFTKVLRGQPNFPTKIKFTPVNSSNPLINNQEYSVAEVVSDTVAIISGSFTNETELKMSVVGTFAPGYTPPTLDKFIYQYDSCTIEFVSSGVEVNTQPVAIEGKEFYLARVQKNKVNQNVTIIDKRIDIIKTKESDSISNIDFTKNPLLGIESIKHYNNFATKDDNLVTIGWGMVTSNWSIDSNLRTFTILGGQGGIFKDTTHFTNGDFDNWRIYSTADSRTESYKLITSSSITGNQINLVVDNLNIDDYILNNEIVIVPNVEEVEIKIYGQEVSTNSIVPGIEIPNLNITKSFPVAAAKGEISVICNSLTSSKNYGFKYRYKNHNSYSIWKLSNPDPIGYFKEISFDENGNLDQLKIQRQIYTPLSYSGFFTLVASSNSFKNLINNIDFGDTQGVSINQISNANTLNEIKVGEDKQTQIFLSANLNLTTDIIYTLETDSAKAGNYFRFIYKGRIIHNNNSIKIYSGSSSRNSII